MTRLCPVRVLVVGSGGREHALAWKLAQSPSVDAVHAAPGNPGIAQLGQCHPIRAEDGDSLLELARTIGADLVVVGPEAPLVAGVADQLRRGGVAVFGPSRGGGSDRGLEELRQGRDARRGSSDRRDDVGREGAVRRQGGRARGRQGRLHVPHAGGARRRPARCRDARRPVRDRGAARGRGAVRVRDRRRAQRAARCPSRATTAACGDGDTGPNTGGMGSYSPVPELDDGRVAELVETIHRPVVESIGRARHAVHRLPLRRADADRRRAARARVQLSLPAIPRRRRSCRGSRAISARRCSRAAQGDLGDVELSVSSACAVTVALAAGTYPEGRDTGSSITGSWRPKRSARSSSTPGRRCATGSS